MRGQGYHRSLLTFLHLTKVSALVAAGTQLCKTSHAQQHPAGSKRCPSSSSWARVAAAQAYTLLFVCRNLRPNCSRFTERGKGEGTTQKITAANAELWVFLNLMLSLKEKDTPKIKLVRIKKGTWKKKLLLLPFLLQNESIIFGSTQRRGMHAEPHTPHPCTSGLHI